MHYPDLTIRGFRGIKELTLPKLGRVNLLAGKNNTGKSSVLEALLLHAQNGSPEVIKEILAFRGEVVEFIETAGTPRLGISFEIMNLFRGSSILSDDFKPIHVSANVKGDTTMLSMDIGLVCHKVSNISASNQKADEPTPDDKVEILRVRTENGISDFPLEIFQSYLRSNAVRHRIEERMPCRIVNPSINQNSTKLSHLWDKVALTHCERDVVEALRLFDTRIEAVSDIRRGRPMVRSKIIDSPVPLRSFGDGMNRMLGIILSLVNARGGILLVDEFENGLHYSVQPDAWRMVFKLARDLNVQVFATTHSRDTIRSFTQVAISSEDIGALIRLNRRGDVIMPITYTEDELEIAYNHAIEVR